MRNRNLILGAAIIALASLPSCAMDPADEVNDGSDVGRVEPLSDDTAPELGAAADVVASSGVEASTDATSAVSAGVTPKYVDQCYQAPWGLVCTRYNDAGQIVGIFNNNRGGGNTIRMTIFRNGSPIALSAWTSVAYGSTFKMWIPYPSAEGYHTCVATAAGSYACSGNLYL